MERNYKMKYSVYYEFDVLRKFNLSEEQLKRIIKKMIKRHPYEKWVRKKFAQNGQVITLLATEFVLWLEKVYFNKSKYYLDLEIDFFEFRIRDLEKELNITPRKEHYQDMNITELMNYFDKSRNSIDVAVHKMVKELGSDIKYKQNNVVIIKASGVKWLNEKYYRKSYLKNLEIYKLMLEEYID